MKAARLSSLPNLLIRIHRAGLIGDEALHELERDLDVEELAMTLPRREQAWLVVDGNMPEWPAVRAGTPGRRAAISARRCNRRPCEARRRP